MHDFYVPEQKRPEETVTFSPCGKYKLVVSTYTTGKNTWSVTLGEVFENRDGGAKIAEVKRNYPDFWSCWVVDHRAHNSQGQDYLLCGADYQGLTIVNLITGEVRSHKPKPGKGWCVASMEYKPKGSLLVAHGCTWACPFEYRVFDFSKPNNMNFEAEGLPDLTAEVRLDSREHSQIEVDEHATIVLTHHKLRFIPTGEYEQEIERKAMDLLRAKQNAQKAGDTETAEEMERQTNAHYQKYWEEDEANAALWETIPYEKQTYTREIVEGPDGEYGGMGLYREVHERHWKADLTPNRDTNA